MPDGRSSRGYVIRGAEHGTAVRPARMSSDLETTDYVRPGLADPRLVDPHLEAVVEQAKMEARARGFRAGHQAGYEAGRQEGLARFDAQIAHAQAMLEMDRARNEAELDELADGVRTALAAALQVQAPTLQELYSVVADMAVQLAEDLVGHHLEVDGCGAKDALERAMAATPRGAEVTVRLHPDDVTAVGRVARGETEWGVARVVPDERVERFGAIVETHDLEIDAQYGRAFERVRKVLRP